MQYPWVFLILEWAFSWHSCLWVTPVNTSVPLISLEGNHILGTSLEFCLRQTDICLHHLRTQQYLRHSLCLKSETKRERDEGKRVESFIFYVQTDGQDQCTLLVHIFSWLNFFWALSYLCENTCMCVWKKKKTRAISVVISLATCLLCFPGQGFSLSRVLPSRPVW